ncbi:MAG: TfoX/Sxy family protein [Pseudomonadota bacterium]
MAAPSDLSTLVARIEAALSTGVASQKRMFGGVTFLINGNMLCCASKQGLMVRVGATAEAKALASPHARPCLGTGRPMPGFIMIEANGFERDADLERWLSMARAYVEALPPKQLGGVGKARSAPDRTLRPTSKPRRTAVTRSIRGKK